MRNPPVVWRERALPPRVAQAAAFLSLLVATALLLFRLRVFSADDAFIHRRIAQHLATTGHAFYNVGERVFVTSSPLWTLLLAGFTLTGHVDALVILFEAVCISIATWLGWRLAMGVSRTTGFRYPYVLALLAAAITFCNLLQSGVEQMETPLAVALLLGGSVLLEEGSDWWLFTFALAAGVRYECYVLLLVAVLLGAISRRLTTRAVLYAGLALVLLNAWILVQYGTVVPNTVKAKAIGYQLTFMTTFWAVGLSRWILLGLLLLLPLCWLKRKAMPLSASVLLAFGMLLCAAYISRRSFIFPWYAPLTRVPLQLGILLGPVLVLPPLLQWFPLALVLFAWSKGVPAPMQELAAATTAEPWRDRADAFNLRVKDYLAVGQVVQSTCPRARLLTSEIGGLGHAFDGAIIDGFGLASPAAIKWHPLKVPDQRSSGDLGAIPVAFVNEVQPDLIVTYSPFAEDLLKHYNASRYRLFTFPSLLAAGAAKHPEMRVEAAQQAPLLVFVSNTGPCAATSLNDTIAKTLVANDTAMWR